MPEDDGWRLTAAERRASYEVVALASLPDVPSDLDVLPGNWPAIAAASIEYLEHGGDPLSVRALSSFARRNLERREDQFELVRLFTDEIVCGPNDRGFTNGRHRVHAMRLAGVARCVVYTKVGERPIED